MTISKSSDNPVVQSLTQGVHHADRQPAVPPCVAPRDFTTAMRQVEEEFYRAS